MGIFCAINDWNKVKRVIFLQLRINISVSMQFKELFRAEGNVSSKQTETD